MDAQRGHQVEDFLVDFKQLKVLIEVVVLLETVENVDEAQTVVRHFEGGGEVFEVGYLVVDDHTDVTDHVLTDDIVSASAQHDQLLAGLRVEKHSVLDLVDLLHQVHRTPVNVEVQKLHELGLDADPLVDSGLQLGLHRLFVTFDLSDKQEIEVVDGCQLFVAVIHEQFSKNIVKTHGH